MTDNLPAYLSNNPSSRRIAEAVVANVGLGSPSYLSIKGNRFTLMYADGDTEPVTTVDPKSGLPYIDICIVDALERESRIYYGGDFDPQATSYSPPDCWSDNGVAPSRNASNPQSPTCAACPQAVWGSATSKVSGKGIPACHKNQKLAFIIPGETELFLLRTPPNSLANLRDFMKKFTGQKFDVSDVVTRVTFDPKVQGTLVFAPTGWLVGDWAPVLDYRNKALAAKATDGLIGRLDTPREGVATIPLAAPTAAVPLTITGPAPIPTAAPAASPSEPPVAAEAQPAGRKRGRPAKPPAAAEAAPAGVAPFRPADPPATPAPFAAGPAPASGNGNFGIAPGVAPNPELEQSLKSIFG